MTVDLIREEPPTGSSNRTGSPFSAWVQDIRSHPGEWFRYPDTVTNSVGSMLRQGKYANTEAGEYKVRTERAAGGRYTIWARYIGEVAS